ncbi:MoaD/ThiS family protein [Streptomyces sp. NPDC059740]|uniref:MoaD/ThiS family protein n=1 Tax=Streptomyces sp. NPDC059740 TaxID=3346926 RepID=UPI003652F0F6
MTVEVRIPTVFQSYTGGRTSVDAHGVTLAEVLADLENHHPGLRARVVTDDGALRRFVNIYVNDDDVRFSGDMETVLHDGDSVMILPAVAGG